MTDQTNDDPFDALVKKFVAALVNDGVAGGSISRDGVSLGIPNWEERTRDQRYFEKAKTHGYPPGLSKSARFLRSQRVAALRDRVLAMREQDRKMFAAAFEALAYAIDAERFTGSFSMRGHNSFPAEEVDTIAENIIVWLAERGHQITAFVDVQPGVPGVPEVRSDLFVKRDGTQKPLDNEAIVNLSELPWDTGIASENAASRMIQRYSRWNATRYSRRKREGGSSNFLFVPAKLRQQDVISRYRAKLSSLDGEDRIAYRASHEALAYAVDAEIFLRSVPSVDLEGDALDDTVNRFTNRLLAWLDEVGYQLVPKPPKSPSDHAREK